MSPSSRPQQFAGFAAPAAQQELHYMQQPFKGVYETNEKGVFFTYARPGQNNTEFRFVNTGPCKLQTAFWDFDGDWTSQAATCVMPSPTRSRASSISNTSVTSVKFTIPSETATCTSSEVKDNKPPTDRQGLTRADLCGYRRLQSPIEVKYNPATNQWQAPQSKCQRLQSTFKTVGEVFCAHGLVGVVPKLRRRRKEKKKTLVSSIKETPLSSEKESSRILSPIRV